MRHGESENNVLGVSNTHDLNAYHLTELGREQSEVAAEYLQNEGIDAIYASPFLRTQETAEVVARRLGVPVIIDPRIAELDELSEDGLKVITVENLMDWNQGHEKDGSYTALHKRIKDFIDTLESSFEGKTFLLITHATPQNMLEAVIKTDTDAEAESFFLSTQRSDYPFKKNAVPYKLEPAPV